MTPEEELLALRDELSNHPGRLLLIADDRSEYVVQILARAWEHPIVSVGRRVADAPRRAKLDPSALIDGNIVTDMDALFWSPAFAIDVLTLIRSAARRRPVAFVWPGEIRDGVARYSTPPRLDSYEKALDDTVILRARQPSFGVRPFTTEHIGP